MKEFEAVLFIIIGAVMGIFSFYMNFSNKNNKMMVFLLAGFVCILIGIINLIFREKRKAQRANKVSHIERTQNIPPQNTFTKYCSKCGVMLREMDRFCYRCGHRMFHRK